MSSCSRFIKAGFRSEEGHCKRLEEEEEGFEVVTHFLVYEI
jgi:hypothetical protein